MIVLRVGGIIAPERPDNPDNGSSKPQPRDKNIHPYNLGVGIAFLALGIGTAFADQKVWIIFLVLGIMFLTMSRKTQKDQ